MANLKTFDLNLLRVLDALLIEQSTVRAGRRLGLSQSAVSAALKRLRAVFGEELFLRQGQGLVPTAFAVSMGPKLQRIMQDTDAILARPADFNEAQEERVFRISGTDYHSELLMPELGKYCLEHAVGIRPVLLDLVPETMFGRLENDTLDMALIPSQDVPGWVVENPLFEAGYALIARQGHRALKAVGIAPGQVIPLPLYCALSHVVFSTEGLLETFVDQALARAGHQRNVVQALPHFSGVCSAVAASDLIAAVPEQYARHIAQLRNIEVYTMPFNVPATKISMIWHRRYNSDPGHFWLRDRVRQILVPGGL